MTIDISKQFKMHQVALFITNRLATFDLQCVVLRAMHFQKNTKKQNSKLLMVLRMFYNFATRIIGYFFVSRYPVGP